MKRRSFLALTAGLSGCRSERDDFIWTGVLFGIEVSIRFRNSDPEMATQLAELAFAKARSIEASCSLWDANSELSRFNRDGFLDSPSQDLGALCSLAADLYEKTNGLFDPSIHSYLEWAKGEYAKGKIPSKDEAKKRRELVNFSLVDFTNPDRIRMPSGMALSLNAIAQGYVTDLVSQAIAAKTDSALVNFGEYRVVGSASFDIEVEDRSLSVSHALAVSSGGGQRLSATSSANHLINPSDGQSPSPKLTVAVEAPAAWLADGLATVVCLGGEVPSFYQEIKVHRWNS